MRSAALVVLQDPMNGDILLVKRKDVPVWVLPGGGIDDGEDAVTAAERELTEETTLTANGLVLRCHFMPVNRWAAETSIFYSNHFEGTPAATTETVDVKFFPLDKLPDSLFILHRQWLLRTLSTIEVIEGTYRGGDLEEYHRLCYTLS